MQLPTCPWLGHTDTSDSEEKMETADDSVSADVIASSGGSGQEREPRATSGSQSLGVPIGWPKVRTSVVLGSPVTHADNLSLS